MTESGVEVTTGSNLGQKKMKLISLLLLLFAALLVISGIFIYLFMTGRPAGANVLPAVEPGKMGYQFSMLGEGDNMLLKPMGIAVAENLIYVSDTSNSRIQVFNTKGEFLLKFGAKGTSPGELNFPYGIAIAPNDEVYVADTYNGNISIFDQNGDFLRLFGLHTEVLTQPAGLIIAADRLYVCNLNPSYILVYNLATEELINIIGTQGTGRGELQLPNDLALGPDGNLYISDTGNNRIQVFATGGEFVRTLDIDPGLIISPRGLAFDSHGQLFVVSKLNNEILLFDSDDKLLDAFGEHLFNLPNGLVIDPKGRLYATDHISVLVFD